MAQLYNSRTWLYQRYVIERKTVIEMATEAKCSHMTIQRALEKHGLSRKI